MLQGNSILKDNRQEFNRNYHQRAQMKSKVKIKINNSLECFYN